MPQRLKRRPFLKTVIAALAGLPFASTALPKTRRYFHGPIPRSEIIGSCFEWQTPNGWANPCPGCDWKIVREVGHMEEVFGFTISNYCHNKFIAIPVTETWPTSEDKSVMVCFSLVTQKNVLRFDLLDSQGVRFYKP